MKWFSSLALVGILGLSLVWSAGSRAPEPAAVLGSFAPGGLSAGEASGGEPRLTAEVRKIGAVDVRALMAARDAGLLPPKAVRQPGRRVEMPISEAQAERLRARALRLSPDPDVQRLDEATGFAPPAGVSFDAIGYDTDPGSVPPDPEIAVGHTEVIAVVNTTFEVYDKATGASLTGGPVDFAAFTGCPGVFDPNALYDEETGRFFMGIDTDGDGYCFAVNATTDPTGTWNVYNLTVAPGALFFDYPHAGVGDEAIFFGGNAFSGNSLVAVGIWAIEKAPLLVGGAPQIVLQQISPVSLGATPQPANLHGMTGGTWPAPGQPHYIMTEVFNGDDHTVWSWSDPFGANVFSSVGVVDLTAASGVTPGFPVDVPQSGSAALLQANDWRGVQTEYFNGNLWTAQAISCNPGAGTVNCIRWAEIDPSPLSVVQAGVFASNGEYRTFPSLAPNHCGDMAIGYSKSSSSIFPGTFVTGRLFSDTPGTLQAETTLQAGQITYTAFDGSPHRWGDYTGLTVDPNGTTFWYLGQYSKITGDPSGRWGTRVGSFEFSTCAATVGLVSEVRASDDHRGGLAIEFETASEAGVALYRMFREEGANLAEVGERALAAQGAPQGGRYRVHDPHGRSGDAYWIAETGHSGRHTVHGPFRLIAESASNLDRHPVGPRRAPQASIRRELAAVSHRGGETRALPSPGGRAANVRLRGRGIRRLSVAELAAALGRQPEALLDELRSQRIVARHHGRPVAFRLIDESSIALFAPGLDSLYTLDDVVRFESGDGVPLRDQRARPVGGDVQGYFDSRVLFEEDLIPAISATIDDDVDYWYWAGLRAGDPTADTATFTLPTPDAVSGQGRVTVRLVGAMRGPAEVDHGARILLGDTEIGQTTWSDFERHDVTLAFDAALLSTESTLRVEALELPGVASSIFFVDEIEATYPRAYRASGDRLEFSGDGDVAVLGFNTGDIEVWDVSRPQRPVRITGLERLDGDGFGVRFSAREKRTYLATTRSSMPEVGAVDSRPAGASWPGKAAEYVVIAPSILSEGAKRLGEYRGGQGLSSRTVAVEELYDRYSGGLPDPRAIHRFLEDAGKTWGVLPRYVSLVGAGTLDPRDLLGNGDNLLAPRLVGTPAGLIPSDRALLPPTATDGTSIGRIPALSAGELDDYVTKLIASEAGNRDQLALMVADDPDPAGDFSAQSDLAAESLPGSLGTLRVDLAELGLEEARAQLWAGLEQSPLLINFVGHGGVDRMAHEGLMTGDDLPDLPATETAGIVSAWTCVLSRFDLPGFDSLGELLVLAPEGGAAAVIAPTGLSVANQAHVLNRLYFEALSESDRVGDALGLALERFSARGGLASLGEAYSILGDPAALLY